MSMRNYQREDGSINQPLKSDLDSARNFGIAIALSVGVPLGVLLFWLVRANLR